MGSGSSVVEEDPVKLEPKVHFQDIEGKLPGLNSEDSPKRGILSTPIPPQDVKKHIGHLYLSGRFNTERKFWYMQKIKDLLQKNEIPTFIAEPMPGKDIVEITKDGLDRAKVMVAFCFDDYGEHTGLGFETYDELKYAHEKKIRIVPVKLSEVYPPQPPGRAGQQQNANILKESIVHIDGTEKSLEQVAAQIRRSWEKFTATPSREFEDATMPRRHLYLSGCFNKEIHSRYLRSVKRLLDAHGVSTFVGDAVPGEDVYDVTADGLARSRVIVAFCSENYGGSSSRESGTTFAEMKYALHRKLKVIPIKLGEFPPKPPDKEGQQQNAMVLKSINQIDCQALDEYEVAEEIEKIWLKFSQDAAGLQEEMGWRRRHLYLSGRFNSDHKFWYVQRMKDLLDSFGVPTFVGRGEDLSQRELAMQGLQNAQALVAFCFEDYGEHTGTDGDSFCELKYAHENSLRIIPIKLGHRYPPEPPDVHGRKQNEEIFKRILYLDGKKMEERDVAMEIRKIWDKVG